AGVREDGQPCSLAAGGLRCGEKVGAVGVDGVVGTPVRGLHVEHVDAGDDGVVRIDVDVAVTFDRGDVAVGGLGKAVDDVAEVGAFLVRPATRVADIVHIGGTAAVGRNDQIVTAVRFDAEHAVRGH